MRWDFKQKSFLHKQSFIFAIICLESHEICLVNIFAPFILVIKWNTFKFISSVLFGKHILPDRLSRVLQLPVHLSQLTING